MDQYEALLRDLTGQVSRLTVLVENTMTVVTERRKHGEMQDRRLDRLEGRLQMLELGGARGEDLPVQVRDHEVRIRKLESVYYKALGYAFAGSLVGGVAVWVLNLFVL